MQLPFKLISTDFDGTIYAELESPPIPPALLELIGSLQAEGAKWVINTGRDMSSLMEALARSGLQIQPDYLVLVERELYERQGQAFASVQPWNDACASDHGTLFGRVRNDVSALTDWISSRFDASLYEDPHSPLCIIAANSRDMDVIHARLEEYCQEVPPLSVVRNDIYARFSHAAYNKGTALAELSRLLKVRKEEVFVAGDQLNDLPMLSRDHAHFIATPANAVPAVLSHVRRQGGYISTRRQGDGVAEALRHFLSQTDSTPFNHVGMPNNWS
jgi:HAD superfamily hydrolase (TIGR01484 family)